MTDNPQLTAPLVYTSTVWWITSMPTQSSTTQSMAWNGMALAYKSINLVRWNNGKVFDLPAWVTVRVQISPGPPREVPCDCLQWRLGRYCTLYWHFGQHWEAEAPANLYLVKFGWFSTNFFADGQHAGWTQIFGGMLYVQIKGGSHQVPQSKRAAAYELFKIAMESIKNEISTSRWLYDCNTGKDTFGRIVLITVCGFFLFGLLNLVI